MSESDLVKALTDHGYSLNESRAYAALLVGGPSTGYEVGQRAQIPRSAVYGALRRLVAAGAARSIAGSPERFVAAPADTLVARLKERFTESVGRLEEAVERLDVRPPEPDAFTVRGHERVLEEARRVLEGATKKLVLSAWPREAEALAPCLAKAAERDVAIWLFSHAAIPTHVPGRHFSHGLPEADLEAFWKHRLVVVADDRTTLVGSAEMQEHDTAVVSQSSAIAELSLSQVSLDITLLLQRHRLDTAEVMAELLGDRVGRLDDLLAAAPTPALGEEPKVPKSVA